MDVVFQPYYHWKGHFKKYSDSLLNTGDKLITSNTNFNFKGSFILYILFRFFLCFLALRNLKSYSRRNDIDKVFFVDIEPLAILFYLKFIRRIPAVIFTIHSIRPNVYGGLLKNLVATLQRKLLFYVLVKLSDFDNVSFVVHSRVHRKELLEIVGNRKIVGVVEYPSPIPVEMKDKSKIELRFIVFGAMRRDKGIYEFINELIKHKSVLKGFKFLFVGKVYDERINNIDVSKVETIDIYDSFITEGQLLSFVDNSDYFLVPYSKGYSGGAGPLKDATSYGMPVFTTNIPLFCEVSEQYGFSIVFDTLEDFIRKAKNVTSQDYRKLSLNAKNFSKFNNWDSLRDNYERRL